MVLVEEVFRKRSDIDNPSSEVFLECAVAPDDFPYFLVDVVFFHGRNEEAREHIMCQHTPF